MPSYLFSELSKGASDIIYTFQEQEQEQELAQVLWAFASLYELADPLLDSLHNAFKDANHFNCCLEEETSSPKEEGYVECIEDLYLEESLDSPVLNFNRDQLGNVAWSYAVLGQMDRIFFSHVWTTLRCNGFQSTIGRIHLVNQCLKLEYPHLQLSLRSDLEEKIARAGNT
ncbi:hypothetical protein HHK36_009122 [Tetracentron sinense]|uniref:Uncharacterized protein n=1 Tax=Tetracentron sinense TaxID=13715 RepID=A0A834ZCF4_TETSI|nr:hypothetical protein HHK36_009122 [Tetracentron sinense]